MMSEKDYAPLSAACVRALHDKLYDKRKTAALEIEKMVKEFAAVNNTGQIKRLLKVLGQDFALSQNPHARKGGLISLAAIAIALGKDTGLFADELIKPILGCMCDQDLRVRYHACESLYNVVKVSREAVLPLFIAIFNALSRIATDPDQNVKNASELLDRLLKDIVMESKSFDLESLMPLLRERLYTKSSFSRQFVISWISVLNTEPEFDLIVYLPDILDGLFRILDDSNVEVKKMCETTLGEFLRSIKTNHHRVNFAAMINILICHANEKNDDLVQLTAITWIKEFVQISEYAMLPYMAGIFTAVLPCLSYDTEARRNIKEMATTVNYSLAKLITSPDKEEDLTSELSPNQLNILAVLEVLTQNLLHNSIQTKVAVLKWIYDLYTKFPNRISEHIDILFPSLLRSLSDDSDQVVQQSLVVVAEVISSKHVPTLESSDMAATKTYYNKFVFSLLSLFKTDKRLLSVRGSFIIRQLCVFLNAEDIYKTLADMLFKDEDLQFVEIMVEQLNLILFTSSELFDVRNKLKELNTSDDCSFFCCLYKTWSHNPVAAVALCLLTQNYNHVFNLIKLFGDLEVTVEFLKEIDSLVQLIESPVFSFLRLELLEVPANTDLIRSLYGLLMLLPQTDAFHTLRIRLRCIPSINFHDEEKIIKTHKYTNKNIKYEDLLNHFIEMQEKHKKFKRKLRAKDILTFESAMNTSLE